MVSTSVHGLGWSLDVLSLVLYLGPDDGFCSVDWLVLGFVLSLVLSLVLGLVLGLVLSLCDVLRLVLGLGNVLGLVLSLVFGLVLSCGNVSWYVFRDSFGSVLSLVLGLVQCSWDVLGLVLSSVHWNLKM